MRIFNILIAISLILTANVFAENIKASGSLDMYSEYIWRGFALDTDTVLQPGFELSGYGFTFSFWSSWDFNNNDSLDGDEIDYAIDYTYDFDYASVSTGHTYYEFPGTDTFSRELYIGASLPVLLSPSLTYYYDYGDEEQGGADGQYLALAVSHSIGLIEDLGITLDLSGKIAYNKKLFINGEGGDALISAGLGIPLYKDLTIAPNINYAMPFGDIDDSEDGDQRDRFYYGFSLSRVF